MTAFSSSDKYKKKLLKPNKLLLVTMSLFWLSLPHCLHGLAGSYLFPSILKMVKCKVYILGKSLSYARYSLNIIKNLICT